MFSLHTSEQSRIAQLRGNRLGIHEIHPQEQLARAIEFPEVAIVTLREILSSPCFCWKMAFFEQQRRRVVRS